MCTLFLLSQFPASAARHAQGPGAEIGGPTLILHIMFGRIKKGCTGFGICHLSASIDWSSTTVELGARGAGTAWMDEGKLNIAFDRTSMSANTLQTYFDGGTFRMEEDFELPAEVATALGIKAYTIRSGAYTIRNSGGANTMQITF